MEISSDRGAIPARVQRLEDEAQRREVLGAAVLDEVRALGERIVRLTDEVQRAVDRITGGDRQPKDASYVEEVERVRRAVREVVPQDASVAVISRGDEDLLRLFGRRSEHFPRELSGKWLGYHPKSSLAAIAHLEVVRALGIDHLVIPASSWWWLEEYELFATHLEKYQSVHQDASCRIYRLEPAADGRSPLERLLDDLGADNSIALDLTDPTSAPSVPGLIAFRPPLREDPVLPYVDRSVPIVLVDRTTRSMLDEARRVASVAVVDVVRGEVERFAEFDCVLPTVSIIMPVYNEPDLSTAAISSLLRTLPAGFRGELIVVDDGSDDRTVGALDRLADEHAMIRIERNEQNSGYLRSVLRGIEAAPGDYLLLVNNDMVFLEGWLEPMLSVFDRFPDTGAVGGRLLYPDGRLQEAGGVLFSDGSAAKFGYRDPDAEHPAYSFVRPVDYCSGCLLLTPRTVFDEVGGVDESFDPGYYEDTDYCMRVRMSGRRVYYQPEAVVVHVEGATAGIDPAYGMKRHQVLNHERFLDKWADVLGKCHPDRPDPCDNPALQRIVLGTDPPVMVR